MKLDNDLPMPQATPTPEPAGHAERLLCVGGPIHGRHVIASAERVVHDGGVYLREHVGGMTAYRVWHANV